MIFSGYKHFVEEITCPRVCNVAHPLFLSDERSSLSLSHIPTKIIVKQSQGCAKLHSLYFLSKNGENAAFFGFPRVCNFEHPLLFVLKAEQTPRNFCAAFVFSSATPRSTKKRVSISKDGSVV